MDGILWIVVFTFGKLPNSRMDKAPGEGNVPLGNLKAYWVGPGKLALICQLMEKLAVFVMDEDLAFIYV
jgi:hypothetical protein